MSQNTQKVVELKIPGFPEFVGVARLTISGIASRMNFSYDEIEDLKIAVAEACNNAIQHAYTSNGDKNDVFIKFLIEEKKLTIEVTDKGKGFNIKKKERKGAKSKESGFGIFLIKALLDEVDFFSDENGTCVKMSKFLK